MAEFKDVPAEDLDRLRYALVASGAKQIQVLEQPNRRFTISFLPGDPDFPTDIGDNRSTR